jgi:hypothetical protein
MGLLSCQKNVIPWAAVPLNPRGRRGGELVPGLARHICGPRDASRRTSMCGAIAQGLHTPRQSRPAAPIPHNAPLCRRDRRSRSRLCTGCAVYRKEHMNVRCDCFRIVLSFVDSPREKMRPGTGREAGLGHVFTASPGNKHPPRRPTGLYETTVNSVY